MKSGSIYELNLAIKVVEMHTKFADARFTSLHVHNIIMQQVELLVYESLLQ